MGEASAKEITKFVQDKETSQFGDYATFRVI